MDELYDELKDYQSEIKEIILTDSKNYESLLEDYHLYDVSRVIISLEPENISSFFAKISDDFSADLFEYLETDEAIHIIKYIPETKIVKIIENMEVDEAVDLLKYLENEGIDLLDKFNLKQTKDFKKLMAYEENQIGSFMSDSFLTVDLDKNVKETMIYVTKEAHNVDYISIIYITNQKELVGYIRLKDLIVARANELIRDIMETRFEKVLPTDDYENVSLIMQHTSESSIPIINKKNQIIGIVTHDDLMDIIDLIEEEDYTKFAAISDSEIDLKSGNLRNSIKSRLPWLSILLLLSMLTSIILGFFEQKFSSSNGAIILASRLAVYLPLILGMAGNTGTQSLAVMIRYLTKNEMIDKSMIRTHVSRELKTGIVQGLIIGVLIFGMIILTMIIRGNGLNNQSIIYATVTSGSVFIALSVSTLLGAIIPLGMNSLKIDPAVASGPFITTVSDIITLSIYYSVSLAILLPLYV